MGTALHRVAYGKAPEGGNGSGAANGAAAAIGGDQSQRLLQLASDLLTIAEELHGTRNDSANPLETLEQGPPPDRRALAEAARETYRARRRRAQFFEGADLFGEPAWDILLDLFIAACDGKAVPVTSACIGAAVPTTTALRWLSVLENRGFIEREADGNDARRIFVRLTSSADQAMSAYFQRAALALRGDEPRLPFMLGK